MAPRAIFLGLGAVSLSAYYYHKHLHDENKPSFLAPLEKFRPQKDVNLVSEASKLIAESAVTKKVDSTMSEMKYSWNNGVRWLYGCLVDSSGLRDGIAVPKAASDAMTKLRSSLTASK